MMADYRAASPQFHIGKITFECWVTDSGERFEWRALDGKLLVGRSAGSGTCWATCNGRRIGFAYPTLKAAMCSAVAAHLGRAAA